MGYLSKTDLRPEVKLEGVSAPSGMQRRAPQLGILICLSATLSEALASGLCYLYPCCCHSGKKGSFSEPAADALARSDDGMAVYVRTGDN